MTSKAMPNRCAQCGNTALSEGTLKETREVDNKTFVANLPAIICGQCGETYVELGVYGAFDRMVAAKLAEMGARSGEALKLMRKAIGMRAADLAELLDVSPETLSRWENGQRQVDPGAMMTVGSLVLDRVSGSEMTLNRLRALKAPAKVGERVVLHLGTKESDEKAA